MSLTIAKWSLDEYHQMIATGLLNERNVELLRGEIIEMVPEGAPHSFYCTENVKYLRNSLGERAKVREAHPITLPNNSEPEPDIAVVRTPANLYRNRHPQPEDIYWLIEIANATLEKDLSFKQEIYAQAGIGEYWVLDLRNMDLVVFQDLQEGVYRSELRLKEGQISPSMFPDLQLDVARILV
jgi:Uma2 family endonuclease